MAALLECKNLSKFYKQEKALENFNYTLEKGRMVGLLGPNGSGKTTLIRLAAGLLLPTSGEILVNGIAPCPQTKLQVSYLPDKLCLQSSDRVNSVLDFFCDFYPDFDRQKALEMLAALAIDPRTRLNAMSKGTKDKVQLIIAMSRKASLFLLDEPIGGVDPAARDYILNTIIRNYQEDASVIFSTHLIADVEKVLDDIVFINKGKLALCGNAEELREKNGKSIDELFREEFKC